MNMKHTRVNEVDLLRFVAAMAVAVFHYAFRGYAADSMTVMPYPLLAPVAKYGYLGVELFFMISGFVILMTAADGNLRNFVVSRVARLYPAYWVCCTITFLATLSIGAPRYTATLAQYLANLTMISPYLGQPAMDGVYWSLLVEIRFYALVAIVLLLKKIHLAQHFIAVWLCLTAVLAAVPCPVPKLGTLLIVEYAPYFIGGATHFLIWSKGPSPFRIAMAVAACALAMHQSIRKVPEASSTFGTEFNAWTVGAIILGFNVAMALISLRCTGKWAQRRWLLAGLLTYPFYLLHQNIGFMIFNRAYPAINPHLLFWGTLLLMLALAYAVHMVVEKRATKILKSALISLFDAMRWRAQGKVDEAKSTL